MTAHATRALRAEIGTPHQKPFGDLDKASVFTDLSVFDTDYIPEDIFVRKEFGPVIRFYYECLRFQLQQALVIVGSTGSGKTLASRYYGRRATEYAATERIPFRQTYVNCREVASPYAFWQELLATLGCIATKGLSTSDLIARLAKGIDGSRHVVLTLDEIEKLFATLGRDKANDILYVLARLRANRELKTAVSLMLISNNTHLMELLETPVRSSLNVRSLTIGSYSPAELEGILRNRARRGLKPGTWSRASLAYVAAKTVQFNADARFAIRLLRNAASEAEQQGRTRITSGTVDNAFAATKTELERDLLTRLAVGQLLVLAALSKAARNTRDGIVPVRPVYHGAYRSLCENHARKPLVYSQFLTIVRGLQNHDLVNNFLERRQAGGFVRLAELNLDLRNLEDALRKSL